MNNAPPAMTYDKEEARQAGEGGRIQSTGAFLGTLTKVKWTVANSGAAGYEIDFKSTTGQVAERITIYTVGKTGKPLSIGKNNIAALLLCMGVKEANPTLGKVEEYDFDSRQKVMNDVYLFPDAMNKPIGLVLQKDLYTKRDGGTGTRMQFECSFNAESRKTAKEIIEEAPAENIDKLLQHLGDKDSRTGTVKTEKPTTDAAAAVFDDDIPF